MIEFKIAQRSKQSHDIGFFKTGYVTISETVVFCDSFTEQAVNINQR